MTLQKLKELILNDTLSDDFLIFLCEDDHFLATQYTNEIAARKNFKINIIKDVREVQNDSLGSLFEDSNSNRLNVLVTDTFDTFVTNYYDLENTIVICDKIDKKIVKNVEPYIVKVKKVAEWAVKDFINVYCPGLNPTLVDMLYQNTNGNIYRIINELDKLNLFDKDEKNIILSQLLTARGTDLYYRTIFDAKNALLKADLFQLSDLIEHKDSVDMDALALTALLLNEYKRNLLLRFNSSTTPEQLGIDKKQVYFIKNNCKLNEVQLCEKIEFLSSIDYKLKAGKLDMDKDQLLTYLISHILA